MTNTSSETMIVPQLLERGNYERWSSCMEDYLISQELWDGIIVPFVFSADHPLLSESEWRKRNAAALHAIKISCGPESFVCIKYTRSAKDALDMLAETHKTEPETHKTKPETDESTPKMNVAMASTIVPELLERGNYERWSIFMKTYLVSQDLWVVTQRWFMPLGVSPKEWRKKNAAALHAIQISCGAEKFNQIKKIRWAIKAWYKLKKYIPVEEEKAKIDNSEHQEEEEEEEEEEESDDDDDDDDEAEEEEEVEEETPKITTTNMIVPQLLERGDYESWRIYMKSYLISQDLWDVVMRVPDSRDSKKEWNKKDAAALHAIQISCGAKRFDEIKYTNSAKIAWNTFEETHDKETNDSDIADSFRWKGFQIMERTQSLLLHNAINKGDVNAVIMGFYKNNPEAKNLGYWTGDSTLHYATMVGKLNIVQALVETMPAVELQQEDVFIGTALSYAAVFGNTEIAEYLVGKDSTLLSTEDIRCEEIPVVAACRLGLEDLTYFLYSKTPFDILLRNKGKQGSKLLLECFRAKKFDIMYDVLRRDLSHRLIDEYWKVLLDGFARTPAAFISGSGLKFWQRWIFECLKVHIPSDFCVVTIAQHERNEIPLPGRLWKLASILLPFLGIKQIHALKLKHVFAHKCLHLICDRLSKLEIRKFEDTKALGKALTRAIENGIYDFLNEMAETNADFLIAPHDQMFVVNRKNFLMDAIAFRQEKIARFIIGLPVGKLFCLLLDSDENNVLHIAGQLASNLQLSRISGAALQMQREMQWFKEVESLVGQYHKDAKNVNGETAYQVFASEHKDLLKEAEDWMKGLASSYIIVGALIITIMFAAAFTLPGGNNQIVGFPLFKDKPAFMVYIIFDAISLFAAVASVLIFLGFLTSRYNMEDFRKSIPNKLMVGLSTLFISLAAMMVAFCSAIFLMLENRWWIIIPSMLLAGILVSLFAWLQFPLLLEIYVLTYKSPIFHEKRSLAGKIKAFFLGKKKIE